MFVPQLYNHHHKLKQVALFIRSLYVLPVFVLVLFSQSVVFNTLVALLYLSLIKYVTGVSLKQLFHLFKLPVFFILTGCLTLTLSFHSSQPFLFYNGFSLGFVPEGLGMAALTFSRSTTIISIVYFGLLTHTISEISEVMRRSKMPKVFIELFVITYKFIENLMASSQQLHTSQKCRLGYQCHPLKSLSLLGFSVFQKALVQTQYLQIAIDSRSVGENSDFIRDENSFRKRDLLFPVLILSVLVLTYLIVLYHGK